MEIKQYISVYKNIFEENKLKDMFEVWKTFDYEDAGLVQGNEIKNNKQIRNTSTVVLHDNHTSKTLQHYSNLFHKIFKDQFVRYLKSYLYPEKVVEHMYPPEILRYTEGGHYTWHTDSCFKLNRALSAIYFINDDYEGGEIQFCFPSSDESLNIKPSANTMIVWPSNFMFPHRVTKVTKGIRYSVVCWAV